MLEAGAVAFRRVGAIAIDGVLDPAWAQAMPFKAGVARQGTFDGPGDCDVEYRMLWDDSALYFFVDVVDDVFVDDSVDDPYFDDSLEIYLDIDSSRGNAYVGDDSQYFFSNRGLQIRDVAGRTDAQALAGVEHVLKQNDPTTQKPGWTMEVRIPWAAMATNPSDLAVQTKRIGFEITVNDDDDGGIWDGQRQWFGSQVRNLTGPTPLAQPC